ncbi:MAG: M67 family metallopeptidase [Dehalococcoidia bacterium]|nr:M67 family metallopeptidase [Dehalococcoidia bacterium]
MFRLKRNHARQIIAHARDEAPNECCGILAGKDGQVLELYRAVNAENSPYRYSIDPGELFRIYTDVESKGWQFLAIYHSHPGSEAYPSRTDIELAQWRGPDGAAPLWPDVCYLIVSLADPASPVIRAFHIEEGRVVEDSILLED